MELLPISWEKVSEMCDFLASKIRESGFSPDSIVGVSRGGLVPARLLSDLLAIRELFAIRVSFYKSMGKTLDFPRIVQPLTEKTGENVLLVDDVSDTGRSLSVAKDHLHRMGAEEVRVATLHCKPHSAFRPDFFIGETSAWIVYPWERNECASEMGKNPSEL
jgi:hypothetical protein